MTPEQMAALYAQQAREGMGPSYNILPGPGAQQPFLQRWGLPIAAGVGALLAGLGIAYAATR